MYYFSVIKCFLLKVIFINLYFFFLSLQLIYFILYNFYYNSNIISFLFLLITVKGLFLSFYNFELIKISRTDSIRRFSLLKSWKAYFHFESRSIGKVYIFSIKLFLKRKKKLVSVLKFLLYLIRAWEGILLPTILY